MSAALVGFWRDKVDLLDSFALQQLQLLTTAAQQIFHTLHVAALDVSVRSEILLHVRS